MSEKDGWVFVNNHESYAAVKAAWGGHFWTDSLNRQLYLHDAYAPIIVQTGRKADYVSFEKFQRAILAAELQVDGKQMVYQGPNAPQIEFFGMTPNMRKEKERPYVLPRIGGKPINLNPEYAYSSPYMKNKAGSSIVTLSYGGRHWVYDFVKNTVTEK